MSYNPYHYPVIHQMPPYPANMVNYPIPRTYPAVDPKIFEGSVKSFHQLMAQASMLLNRLGNVAFSRKLMSAAQQGKQAEVDKMIKSIGLRVPVATKFNPTDVHFILTTPPTPYNPINCCTLTVGLKWSQ
ncbi:hypothetical protein QNH20_05210 [Neobacillus sp. WH10]|uniref:hypothetical protein n=1 Tax=Neobacillus sp. WH10 TaxID=3047873 RepID=UPI0024C119BE|nr:hypothetical protein [Neobacillus sp. WH10]WHY78544.1 hypothetical protein QNH20_05210 [Neobacillus sp. WH10]